MQIKEKKVNKIQLTRIKNQNEKKKGFSMTLLRKMGRLFNQFLCFQISTEKYCQSSGHHSFFYQTKKKYSSSVFTIFENKKKMCDKLNFPSDEKKSKQEVVEI